MCTTEIIPRFAQNCASYSAVILYKVKRRHCYRKPFSVCKREKSDQFNISLNYVYKCLNTTLLAWLNGFILGSMRNVKHVMECICAAYVDSRKKHFEPPHDKTNKMTFEPSENSDQPGHPPSLIRVFVVRSVGSLGPNFASGGQR